MSRYKYILIDLDDTLIDFEAAQRQTFFETMTHFGVASSEDVFTEYRVINNELWLAYERSEIKKADVFFLRWERFFKCVGKELTPTTVNSFFLQHLGEHPILFSGAIEFCRLLAKSHKLVVVTNGDSATQRMKVDNSGLAPYIHAYAISDEVGAAKPNSRIFIEALKAVGASDKKAALMIGDNIHADVVGAMEFGIDVCWFNPRRLASPIGVVVPFAASTYEEIIAWLEDPGVSW